MRRPGGIFTLQAVVLILMCGAPIFATEKDTDNVDECINPSGKFGYCIPLNKCKVLFQILKEIPRNLNSIKFLQRSTCEFHKDEPWVCCVVEGNKNNTSESSTARTEPKLTTLSEAPKVSEVPGSSNVSVPDVDKVEQELMQHPNFKLLPTLGGCGNSLPTDRIIGGTETGLGTYPWMALLGFIDATGETLFGCGGTLINSRYVLTAAHCVSSSKLPEGIKLKFVRLGEYDQRTDPDCQNGICAPKVQDIPVEEQIPHEKYDETGTNEKDVAILRLKKEATLGIFVSPICLPTGEILRYDLEKSNRTIVAGWGRQKDVLQHVNVPVRSWQDCFDFYSRKGFRKIDNTRFCAGGEKGKDSCQGDSGGPLMETIYQKNLHQARTWQFGVVSLGPSPCGSSNPALYTRITEMMPWILNHLKP